MSLHICVVLILLEASDRGVRMLCSCPLELVLTPYFLNVVVEDKVLELSHV